jgi:catechol 2,3-dioxygenase-like lactoylglutathione lyase family enzyme
LLRRGRFLFENITTVAVYVSDADRAKKFYTEILGFQVAADIHPNLCFMKSESGRINIYLEGGKSCASVDEGTCRLSFFLQAEKSAQEVFDHLRSEGVKLLQEAPELVGDDTYCFQFEDPDGNILEVAGGPRSSGS